MKHHLFLALAMVLVGCQTPTPPNKVPPGAAASITPPASAGPASPLPTAAPAGPSPSPTKAPGGLPAIEDAHAEMTDLDNKRGHDWHFAAALTGGAVGTARATLIMGEMGRKLRLDAYVIGLSGPAEAVRLRDGEDGVVLFSAEEGSGSSWVPGLGRFEGTVSGTGAEVPLTDAVLTKLEAGRLVVDVQPDGATTGACRGRLEPVRAAVNGLMYPPVLTSLSADTPRGIYTATLSRDQETFKVDVNVDKLSSKVQAVHVHKGTSSEPGPIFQTLTLAGAGEAHLALKARDAVVFYSSVITSTGEDLYVDVHTEAHPEGEMSQRLIGMGGP